MSFARLIRLFEPSFTQKAAVKIVQTGKTPVQIGETLVQVRETSVQIGETSFKGAAADGFSQAKLNIKTVHYQLSAIHY